MRAFVFTDAGLARQAGRFVWLEIDTEMRENAFFRQRYAVQALPSFFIVDPESEAVVLRWVGGATVAQLNAMLDEGHTALVQRRQGTPPASTAAPEASKPAAGMSPDALLARADELYGEGKNGEAVAFYRQAVVQAPSGWPAYARATESLLFAALESHDYATCTEIGRAALPKLRSTASAVNVAAIGLDAALSLPPENAQRTALVTEFESAARAIVDDAQVSVAADDRSGLYAVLVQARSDAKDSLGAHDMASRWAHFLEQEAARAKSPEGRTVFDAHRLSAYLELGEPARAIPMLEASERDFPDDYNPPARLAVTYKELERWDDGIAASRRALEHVYGPRKLRVLQNLADIYRGKGDVGAARSTLQDALQLAQSLPPGQFSESTVANLEKKIGSLPNP